MNRIDHMSLAYSAMTAPEQRSNFILSLHREFGEQKVKQSLGRLYLKGYIDNHTPLAMITPSGQQKLKTVILREREKEIRFLKKLQEKVLTESR